MRPSEGGAALHAPGSHRGDPGLTPTEGSRQATVTSPTWVCVWGSVTKRHMDSQGHGQPRGRAQATACGVTCVGLIFLLHVSWELPAFPLLLTD